MTQHHRLPALVMRGPSARRFVCTAPGIRAALRATLVSLTASLPLASAATPAPAAVVRSAPSAAKEPASPAATSPATAAWPDLPFRPQIGINLPSASYGSANPGREEFDYTWPSEAEVRAFATQGVHVFRLAFTAERLQDGARGDLRPHDLARLRALVEL